MKETTLILGAQIKGHWRNWSARAKKWYYIIFSGYATTESQHMI